MFNFTCIAEGFSKLTSWPYITWQLADKAADMIFHVAGMMVISTEIHKGYPLVIEHSELENGPFMGDFFSSNSDFLVRYDSYVSH